MYPVEQADPTNPKPFAPEIIAAIAAAKNQQAAAAAPAGNFAPVAYSGPSATEMAAKDFAPQFAALQSVVDRAAQTYSTGYKDIGSAYDALGNQIAGQADSIRGQYDATGQKIGATYNDAINSVNNNQNSSMSRLAEMLQRLGIGQAAGDSLGSVAAEGVKAVGALNQTMASRQGFNTQQGQNELSNNQRTADVARLAGKNKQADLTRNYQDIQAANDQKRLGLVSSQSQAANQYAQQIAKMQADSQSSAFDQWYKMQQLGVSQGNAELDLQKYKHQVDNDAAANDLAGQKALNGSGDAYAILASRAGQIFGAGSTAASDAIDRVMRAYQTASNDMHGQATLSDIQKYAAFNSRSAEESRAMQGLAALWYQQLGNKNQYGFQS